MNNQTLESTAREKDLGVIITDNLKVAGNCHAAYSRANRVLGRIRRTISYKTPEILLPMYNSLVEYCVPA